MAGHRYRTNKIKRMHSIIHGLLPILEAMAAHPAIAQITPGRISANRRAADRNITLQYYTDSGMKLLARNPSTIQEVFIVTSEPEEVHAWLVREGLISNSADNSAKGAANSPAEPQKPAASSANAPAAARTRAARTQVATKQTLGHIKGHLGVYADYLDDPDVPATLDAPTDALVVADHLQGDVAARLRRLRDQVATEQEPAAGNGSRNGSRNGLNSGTSGKKGGAGKQPKPSQQLPNGQAVSRRAGQAAPTARNGQKRSAEPPAPTTQKAHASPAGAQKPASGSSAKAAQPHNDLAAWLDQADDNTFQRLVSKYKGGNR